MRYLTALLTLMGVLVPAAIAQDLSAVMKNDGDWISRSQPLVFILSHRPAAGERMGLVVGTEDVSDLCVLQGDTLLYQPQTVLLPSGSVVAQLYVVTADGNWNPAGTYSLNILTTGALERAAITPSLSVANKGQPAEEHVPDGVGGGRKTFQELNGQLAMKAEAERAGIQASLGFSLIGVSFRQEAIRFAEKREDAAKIDLSSYIFETRIGKTTLDVGHFTHGRERHLLNGFASRGVSASTAISSFFDLSAAVLNATNIVGWDNLTGLDNPNHRIYSGTLGLEILPSTPGSIRLEASYAQGSQLPLSNFNQGQITDAEQSKGGALRLQLADPGRSVTVDAGIARARFTNPANPLIPGQFQVVQTEPTTRWARYADVTWDAFRNEMLFHLLPARLSVAFRHERVDPLYRVVGAVVRSDNLSNTYEAHGGLGPLQLDASHLQSEDNLDDLPSVLKTKTQQTGVNASLVPAVMADFLPSWAPTLTVGLNVTHQFGTGVPTNSDMTATRVPDQVTTSKTAGIECQLNGLRAGYRGAYTLQDNRQVGRENADVANQTHAISLSISAVSQLMVTIDGSLESLENKETQQIVRTNRIGLGLSASVFRGCTTSINGTLSRSKDKSGSASQTQGFFSIESSYAFDLSRSFVFNWRGQVFARYSWNESTSANDLFDIHSRTRAWVISTGISFNLF